MNDNEHIDYLLGLLKPFFPVTISEVFPDVIGNERVQISWESNGKRLLFANTPREAELILEGMFAVVQSQHYR